MNEIPEAKLLHDILGALRGIRDEIHAITEKQKTAEHENTKPTKVQITSQPSLPVSIGKYYESQNAGWKTKWEKIKTIFEIAAFAGVVFAGIYTIRTFTQIKRQADATVDQVQTMKRQFEVDQRPYIWLASAQLAKPVTNAPIIGVPILYANAGKSPAQHVKPLLRTFPGPGALGRADQWFKGLTEDSANNSRADITVIQGAPPRELEIPSYDAVPVGTNLSELEYVAAMRFIYFDAFGNRYWTDACVWHLPHSAPNATCPSHNDIH